jgi:DNA-binding IclR family transcriptional regulator
VPALLTVKKIGPVLDLFSVEDPEWGVTEVAEQLRIAKSSAHALLVSLVEVGLLSSTAQSRYRLGWRFLDLGETLKASLDIRPLALPVMRALVARHRETVELSILDRGRVLYLERVEGTHPVRFSGAPVGAHRAAHASASGKVLLALRPRGEVDRIAALEGLPRLTAATNTDLGRLHDELIETRRNGFATDVEELVPGVSCVAAPVCIEGEMTLGALSISAPSSRFRAQSDVLARAVVDGARAISHKIGWSDQGSAPGKPAGAESVRHPSRRTPAAA